MENSGDIKDLELQPKFELRCGGTPVLVRSERYFNGRKASYKADFRYYDNKLDEEIVEDVKGHLIYTSALKIGMIEAEYGVRVVLVR